MCGRFSLTSELESIKKMIRELNIEDWDKPRYNIAPTQQVATIIYSDRISLLYTRWGLVPSWAKDLSIGNRLINARAETLHEKPSFKNLFRQRRCLILADGFYEWQKQEGVKGKVPWHFRMRSKEPFAFAGLWDSWKDKSGNDEPIISSTIITTEPNNLVKPVHARMPVILKRELYKTWLSPKISSREILRNCLEPYPAEEMEAFAVSNQVNSPAFDGPECVIPISNENSK